MWDSSFKGHLWIKTTLLIKVTFSINLPWSNETKKPFVYKNNVWSFHWVTFIYRLDSIFRPIAWVIKCYAYELQTVHYSLTIHAEWKSKFTWKSEISFWYHPIDNGQFKKWKVGKSIVEIQQIAVKKIKIYRPISELDNFHLYVWLENQSNIGKNIHVYIHVYCRIFILHQSFIPIGKKSQC